MTGNRRSAVTAVLPAVVVLGMLVLLWAATTGPVAMLGTATGRSSAPVATPTRTPTSTASASGSLPTYRQVTKGVRASVDLSWLGQLIAYTALLALCWALYLLVRSLWRNRWRRPDKPVEVPFDLVPDGVLAEAVARDAPELLAAVEQGGPRDGIVACWLRLEDSVASSGVVPRAAETSSELAGRVLRGLDVDPHSVARLAELYREARFSRHPMPESSRAEAREALRTIHRDLSTGVSS